MQPYNSETFFFIPVCSAVVACFLSPLQDGERSATEQPPLELVGLKA